MNQSQFRMSQSQLIDAYAVANGTSTQEAKKNIEVLFSVIKEHLLKDVSNNLVAVPSLGSVRVVGLERALPRLAIRTKKNIREELSKAKG